MSEMLVTVNYHYENVPMWIRPIIKGGIFMDRRHLAVKAIDGLYEKINKEWDKTGKPTSFGSYLEDINPEYEAFINEHVQPVLDEKLNRGRVFRMISGKYGDLEMTIFGLKNSRIWIDLTPIN